MARLAVRLHQETSIPGLTVFQAKGREWERVGVVLTRGQRALLDAGLHALDDEHCVLYVALTRAKRVCVELAPHGPASEDTLDLPVGE